MNQTSRAVGGYGYFGRYGDFGGYGGVGVNGEVNVQSRNIFYFFLLLNVLMHASIECKYL